MIRKINIVAIGYTLSCTFSLTAIKPTKTFVDFLNRVELHAYNKGAVHRSFECSLAAALAAGGTAYYCTQKYVAQKSSQAMKSSGPYPAVVCGGAALVTACLAGRSVFNCARLWNLIKKSNMPAARSQEFQTSVAQGLQPHEYYWQAKPLKNLFFG